ncbi:MAG: 50S ribosomal protein L13 [Candidatus Chisholmbacteria bacterium RIFCSPHIGHO2_01_FULL_48_12]|uniref:Large ribosomal subunit protein uL13 n=1 Tax=Candidatus Chisholmbacteria bacterium RIFCSPHIGHO2_01_FULL_48_12 TaxID=1797589 RepID=A0A1G1VLY3_9BACT|nr:MAG: 50S ribosomal protein L13 [Candidatus Chisholmbacteria bacterium RIFCSPHIGHO2_01_FULL_48_12]
MKKTYVTKLAEITREWQVIDVKDKILGRVAVEIANKLMGKHKPVFTPQLDCGDYVVAVNAASIRVSGRKKEQKVYFRHSGYPGGERVRTFADQLKRDPGKILEEAVKGMLPKNKLRDRRMRRLKVFAGEEHKYHDKF